MLQIQRCRAHRRQCLCRPQPQRGPHAIWRRNRQLTAAERGAIQESAYGTLRHLGKLRRGPRRSSCRSRSTIAELRDLAAGRALPARITATRPPLRGGRPRGRMRGADRRRSTSSRWSTRCCAISAPPRESFWPTRQSRDRTAAGPIRAGGSKACRRDYSARMRSAFWRRQSAPAADAARQRARGSASDVSGAHCSKPASTQRQLANDALMLARARARSSACPDSPKARSRCRTRPRSLRRTLLDRPRACACSTRARRPAARPRISWNSPTST